MTSLVAKLNDPSPIYTVFSQFSHYIPLVINKNMHLLKMLLYTVINIITLHNNLCNYSII